MMSVFKVGVSTFSSNTTILLVVGTDVEVNAVEIKVVEPPPGAPKFGALPVIKT